MSRKEKLRVYHGLPKSVRDNHTLLYLGFDGSLIENGLNNIIESTISNTSSAFVRGATGCAFVNYSSTTYVSYYIPPSISEELTIDFIVNSLDTVRTGQVLRLYVSDSSNTYLRVAIIDDFTLHCDFVVDGTNKYNWLSFKNLIDFNQNCNHVRIVLSSNSLLFYINGQKYSPTNNLSDYDFNYYLKAILPNIKFARCYCRLAISDLHISNVNRGNYFTNLPQDFIYGKAIIKPKMGQQQIKGDPVIIQPTTVVIPAYVEGNQSKYVIDTSDNTGTLINNPEVTKIANASTWESDISSFTIKGLNSELITDLMVTTTSGIIVTGTCSGLGTKEVKFTLGTNSGLTGKDLVVNYNLNIPQGNSDFTELPFEILNVFNENGESLTKVSSVKIKDNFYEKTYGDLKVCPHIAKYEDSAQGVLDKNAFTKEVPQNNYNIIGDTNSNVFSLASATNNTCQVMFAFNVVEIIERKLGSNIPGSTSAERNNWLDSNISNLKFSWTGKASLNGSTEIPIVRYHVYTKNAWRSIASYSYNPWIGNITTPAPLMPTSNGAVKLMSDIMYGNYVYVVVETSSTQYGSKLDTNYVDIEVELKSELNFDMYCLDKSPMARYGGLNNPVLIQKQTKTVKRYLPSKECFSTEYSYAPIIESPNIDNLDKKGLKVSSHGRYFLSSLGTGKLHPNFHEENLNQLPFKFNLSKYTGNNFIEIPYESLVDISSNNDYGNLYTNMETIGDPNVQVLQGLIAYRTPFGFRSSQGVSRKLKRPLQYIPTDDSPDNYYGLAINLYIYNNEICLLISNCSADFDFSSTNKVTGLTNLYRIPNRPLIK